MAKPWGGSEVRVVRGSGAVSSRRRAALSVALGALVGCGRQDPPGAREVRRLPPRAARDAAAADDSDWGHAAALVSDGTETREVSGSGAVALAPDGRTLAVEEEHAASPWRAWISVRDATTLAARTALPLCLGGPGGGRAASPCPEPTQRRPVVHGLVFSPDGAAVAAACTGCAPGQTGTVHAFRTDTGALLFAVAVPFRPAQLAWGARGVLVAGDSRARLLDAARGTTQRELAFEAPVVAVALDGSALMVHAMPPRVERLDGSPPWTFHNRWPRVPVLLGQDRALDFEHGVATYSSDYPAPLESADRGVATAFAVSHAGVVAATIAADLPGQRPQVRIFSVVLPELVSSQAAPELPRALAVASTGVVWVTSAMGGVQRSAPGPAVVSVDARPAAGPFLTVEREGLHAPFRWSARLRATWDGPATMTASVTASIDAAVLSPDGRSIALALPVGTGSEVRVVAIPGGATMPSVTVGTRVTELAWGPRGLAALGRDAAYAIDPRAGVVTATLAAGADRFASLSRDGEFVLASRRTASGEERPLPGGGHLWTVATLRWVQRELHGGVEHALGEGPAAQAWLLGNGGSVVQADGQTVVRSGPGAAAVPRVIEGTARGSSADGRWLAAVDGSYTLRVYDVRGGGGPLRTESLRGAVAGVSVADDGVVYLAMQDGTARRVPR